MAYRVTTRVNKIATALTLAEYIAWAQAIVDALIAVGIVQTSDTGQVILSTISALPLTGVSAGYMIFRFNDSMQATRPLYFKLTFSARGTSPNAWYFPSLGMSIARGSDGLGSLVGSVTSTVYSIIGTGTGTSSITLKTGTATSTVVSSGDGYLHMALGHNSISPYPTYFTGGDYSEGFFSIMRSTDSSGGVDGRYVSLVYRDPYDTSVAPVKGPGILSIDYDSTAILTSTSFSFLPLSDAVPSISGGTPVFPMYAPTALNPILSQLVLVNFQRALFGDTFSVAIVGSTLKPYFALGKSFSPMDNSGTGLIGLCGIAILTEGPLV